MNITHVITGLEIGGAERALYSLLLGGLADYGENRVISLTGEGHYGPLLRNAGFEVISLNAKTSFRGLFDLFESWQRSIAGPSDIFQGWMYHGNLAAAVAQKQATSPSCLAWNIRQSLESPETLKRSTRVVTRLGSLCSKAPDAIIYNSKRSKRQHEDIGYQAMNGLVVPNGFDLERWRPDAKAPIRLRKILGLDENSLLIGYVGRGYPQKDLPNLFEAFAQTTTRISQRVALVCIGRDLERWVPSKIDRGSLHFLGQRSDLEALMPGFDILCLSSKSEGFPNVVGEAMACGVPCVTTDVGDAADIVGTTGWVAAPRDSEALGQALHNALSLSRDERSLRGVEARARIEARYALRSVAGQYTKLYDGFRIRLN